MNLESRNTHEEFYKKLYLIRRAEEAIVAEYPNDDMKTPMHMSFGHEAIAVGVCEALGKEGQVLATYRSHAVYLAKSGNAHGFFSELYGKGDALAKGKAGSMHLSDPASGHLGSSAIVASGLPVAVGAAFANKQLGKKRFTATFFGDGAVDQGVFWESMNASCLMRLPVVFVCEDNGLAVHTAKSERHGYSSIADVARQFRCVVGESESTDVSEIAQVTRDAMDEATERQRPVFLHFQCYRYLEHVGIGEDFSAGYRDRSEYERWRKVDPIVLQRSRLLRDSTPAAVENLEREVDTAVEAGIGKAKEAPFADGAELYKEVFA